MFMRPVHVERLETLAAYIEKKPDAELNMAGWHNGSNRGHREEVLPGSCGTTQCIAGFVQFAVPGIGDEWSWYWNDNDRAWRMQCWNSDAGGVGVEKQFALDFGIRKRRAERLLMDGRLTTTAAAAAAIRATIPWYARLYRWRIARRLVAT